MKINSKKGMTHLFILTTCLVVGSVIAFNAFNNSELILSATEAKDFSVTYSRASGEFVDNGNNKYTTSATSDNGNTSYLCAETHVSFVSDYIASFPSMHESTIDDTVITFTTDDDGENAHKFQFLKSISASISSNSAITWHIEMSYDGSSWSDAGDMTFSSKAASSNCVLGAKYIRISEPNRSGISNYYVNDVTITYSCSESSPIKSLSSLTVAEDKKTTYDVGDEFVAPKAYAHYDGETGEGEEVAATFTGYDMSTSGKQTVTASYTEEGVTKTATYQINVGSAPAITGSYVNSMTQATFDFDNCTYTYYGYVNHFTYVFSGSVITFTLDETKVNDDFSNFGSNRLFTESVKVNSTTSYSETSFTIKIYNAFSSTTVKTFTKAN